MRASADRRQIQARYSPRGMLAHLVDLIALQSQNLIAQIQFRERFQRENSFSLPINKGHRGTLTFEILSVLSLGYVKLRQKWLKRFLSSSCFLIFTDDDRNVTQSALKNSAKINISSVEAVG